MSGCVHNMSANFDSFTQVIFFQTPQPHLPSRQTRRLSATTSSREPAAEPSASQRSFQAMDASYMPPLRHSIYLANPSHSLIHAPARGAGGGGWGGRERRSNLRWTRNTSFVTLMHPPEAASGALRSRGSDCRRAEEARAESYRSMLLLLMMLTTTTTMMMLITIRQGTHTRTPCKPLRVRARRRTWHGTSPPRSVRRAGLHRMDDNWIEGRRREEVRMRRSELRREKRGRAEEEEQRRRRSGEEDPPSPSPPLVSQSSKHRTSSSGSVTAPPPLHLHHHHAEAATSSSSQFRQR